MSLYVAPRRKQAVAGVVGYSGALVGADLLAAETASKPPVLLVHGDADPIVPFQSMERAAQALRGAGLDVQTLARPGLPHSIDDEGILAAIKFLGQAFAKA